MRLAAALVVGFGVPAAAAAYPEGGPPAHTGGFGEPTCQACHFDAPTEAGGGRVRIAGLPERFAPGRSYELVLEVDGAATVAGFQLSARDGGGQQAGSLMPVDGTTQRSDAGGVEYLGHTPTGARSGGRWAFRWRAPLRMQRVLFHAAANAANGDQSEFGDRIVLYEALTAMERRR